MKNKVLSMYLSFIMIITFMPVMDANASTKVTVYDTFMKSSNEGEHTIYGTYLRVSLDGASSWAIDELISAIVNGLYTDTVTYDYQANITREEFCELVMLLYEKLIGGTAETGPDVFLDTDNISVRKAHSLGIVNGVSSGMFAPNNFITRQEICTMLVRAIEATYTGIDLGDYNYVNFADSYAISSWAMEEVQIAYDNDIIRGVGDGIDPLGNTTCEQAMLLVNRIYEKRNLFESMVNNNLEKFEQ